ncbi:hypothetical protein [Acetivibrio mesophilus]|uniref:Uncharacterized protein n=1 Tax=Acetivibrio mesophilus TaxID=2487273 RepID=A0A4V1K2A5_9FIRM|nr:hypothetical protein [Acetivibrio mesophilus]ODM25805.1 hypothetical protein A7W90_05950 [Clostridium sp. Bc-iso-3]RXE59609.1 hypothetical protein EFD62_06580 [Acetivibrio mesophilus]HHV30496.1 hypothetical protein [Clostridium sp.]
MVKYLKRVEELMKEALSGNDSSNWEDLANYYKSHIEFLQHERQIHLLVTLFFGLFFLMSVLAAAISEKLEILVVAFLFLVLLIPYIAHYYKLENGVQRLYELYSRINEKYSSKNKTA